MKDAYFCFLFFQNRKRERETKSGKKTKYEPITKIMVDNEMEKKNYIFIPE